MSLLMSTFMILLICTHTSASAVGASNNTSNILYERWDGIDKGSILYLKRNSRYPDNPTSHFYLDSDYFEAPSDVGNRYGCRLTGYFLAPETGVYSFVVAADDEGELWLDGKKIVYPKVPTGLVDRRQWTRYPSQTSDHISLTAGIVYELIGLLKENYESDHFSAGVTLPSASEPELINASYFVPHPSVPCAAGSGSVWEVGGWGCIACPGGKYSDHPGYTCDLCPAGKYSQIENATTAESCEPCEAGEGSAPGSKSCLKCQAGSYSGAKEDCRGCPAKSYAPRPGMTSCDLCPEKAMAAGSFCVHSDVHEWDFRGCEKGMPIKDKHTQLNVTAWGSANCTAKGLELDGFNDFARIGEGFARRLRNDGPCVL